MWRRISCEREPKRRPLIPNPAKPEPTPPANQAPSRKALPHSRQRVRKKRVEAALPAPGYFLTAPGFRVTRDSGSSWVLGVPPPSLRASAARWRGAPRGTPNNVENQVRCSAYILFLFLFVFLFLRRASAAKTNRNKLKNKNKSGHKPRFTTGLRPQTSSQISAHRRRPDASAARDLPTA